MFDEKNFDDSGGKEEDPISPEQLKGLSTSSQPSSDQKEIRPEDEMLFVRETEYKKLVAEAQDYKNKYMRLIAEFDNARKRMGREKQEFVKYANEGLLTEFLNVLDDLERSIEAARAKHEDYTAFLQGIEMVMGHIDEMLKKNNVKSMETVGKKFDPHRHEALMQEETDKAEDETILEEFQKGYLLDDKVLRSAKVKVAKNKNNQ